MTTSGAAAEVGERYDVVIAGAGIAGCTAAVLYARQGLRVALLEAHRDPATFKRICTHYIQPSAVPTMRRLGLDRSIEAAGGVRNGVDIWTPYGWVTDERAAVGVPEPGYNIRRSVLDPMLRELAASTPGVDLLLGHKVTDLVRTGNRVDGLRARTQDGRTVTLRATLTVGAEGRLSTVATQSGLRVKTKAHGRFGYSAHYTGVQLSTAASSQFWLDGQGMNFAFTNDGGRTVIGAMRPSGELAAFRADPEGNLLESFDRLPGRPDLSAATRVSDVIGMINYPLHRRRVTGRGVTLVGDAALVADYLWGVGCGWAFQSAEWLVDATAADLLRSRDPSPALRSYARRIRRRLGPHHTMTSDYATGRPFTALERLLWSSATVDDEVAAALGAVGARSASPLTVLKPMMVARMVRARRRAAAPVNLPPARTAVKA
ncbi:MAG: hypothetical protein QOJ32_3003 [Frankiaceae bacterium]|nr:hypothetical protein [Frankiaceae bacterium]